MMKKSVLQSRSWRIFKKIFWILCSLKLAIVIIFAIAVSLAAGTVLESVYDTPTAQYWIYRSFFFHSLMGLLGISIFCVAVSRYPWKVKHIPFLLAHAGILILLGGSWMTENRGVDGNLRITEGETASVVELDNASLVIVDQGKVHSISIPWLPPHVPFKPFEVKNYGLPYDLKVDRFLSHADPLISFVPADSSGNKALPALHLRITGGAMGISQDLWLWEGTPAWKAIEAGPALFSLGKDLPHKTAGRPWLAFFPEKNGALFYVAQSSQGKRVTGRFSKGKIQGQTLLPGWKGGIRITLEEWIPDAVSTATYNPARIEYGNLAPPSAIHVSVAKSANIWLGLDDHAVLHLEGREIEIGYSSKRIGLPFEIHLDRFTIEHDQGTLSPASYASQVRVSLLSSSLQTDGFQGQKEVTISMNEPLEMMGYTVYQASYEDAQPRPMTSIFAVNRDPGRPWKYLGSLLIVTGAIFLFASKYHQTWKVKQTRSQKPYGVEASPEVS